MALSPYWPLLLIFFTPLPFRTSRRGQRIPWITYTLIALNVIVYVFTRANADAFNEWGLVPARPHFRALLTGMFLHDGLAHLLGNMLFLWLFGSHVEEALGREAFLALYFGGGIAAGLLHMAIVLLHGQDTFSPLVGASGAISAILAPFAVRFHRAHIHLYWLPGVIFLRDWAVFEVPALSAVILWFLFNIAGGICFLWLPDDFRIRFQWSQWLLPADKTAYWAHIGGFIFGLVAAELTGLLREGRQDYLLQDARLAAARGQEARTLAIQKYRAFLNHDPDNAPVRAELGRLLAAPAAPETDTIENDRLEAALEMLAAIRVLLKQGESAAAAQCAGEARAFGLALPLTPRERLRLAGAAEGAGDEETALLLLKSLIAETPEAPEDEMARLKLGQLLRERDRDEAKIVLTGFLEKYPHSEWGRRARELQSERQTNV